MGKRGGWLYALKKVFSCESSQNRVKKNRKSGRWFGKQKSLDLESYIAENTAEIHAPPMEDAKLIEAENEQNRHAYSVAVATAAAAEAAVAAAHAAAEVVRLTAVAGQLGKSKEEIAAIKIQTAFRGYLARRALRALKGLGRLKSLLDGQSVRRQAATTLKYMQTLSRMQTEVRARRIRMSEENSAIQRQIQQKREKELEKLRIGEDWDDSMQSKEQIEANLQHRQEAALRRERALAYAYTHQQTWRKSSNFTKQTFMDPNNPHWGWSWMERWMATRPSESGITTIDKEPNSDQVSVKSTASRSISFLRDSRIQSPTAHKQSRPPSRQSPSTPKSKVSVSKFRQPSPSGTTATTNGMDDDSKSVNSRCRRHSIGGSSVRDDESLDSSASGPVRGYLGSTESAKAKSRQRISPLDRTPEKWATSGGGGGGGSAKRLSFSGSPAGPTPVGPRRHSEPTKIDFSSPDKDTTGNL